MLSSASDAELLSLMMQHIDNSSDLNTPDIKLDDFSFTVHDVKAGVTEVSSSSSGTGVLYDSDVVLGGLLAPAHAQAPPTQLHTPTHAQAPIEWTENLLAPADTASISTHDVFFDDVGVAGPHALAATPLLSSSSLRWADDQLPQLRRQQAQALADTHSYHGMPVAPLVPSGLLGAPAGGGDDGDLTSSSCHEASEESFSSHNLFQSASNEDLELPDDINAVLNDLDSILPGVLSPPHDSFGAAGSSEHANAKMFIELFNSRQTDLLASAMADSDILYDLKSPEAEKEPKSFSSPMLTRRPAPISKIAPVKIQIPSQQSHLKYALINNASKKAPIRIKIAPLLKEPREALKEPVIRVHIPVKRPVNVKQESEEEDDTEDESESEDEEAFRSSARNQRRPAGRRPAAAVRLPAPRLPSATPAHHLIAVEPPNKKLKQENLSEKEKYMRIRQLNNEASKRCRERRKEKLSLIEQEERALLTKNQELKHKYELLKRLKERMNELVASSIRQGASVT